MRRTGVGILLAALAITSALFGLVLIAPIVWGAIVAVANTTAAAATGSFTASKEAFLAYLGVHPGRLGTIALFAAGVLGLNARAIFRGGGRPRSKPRPQTWPGFAREDEESP